MSDKSGFLALKRSYFLFVLVVVIYRFLSHSLLHQLGHPVLIYPGKDEVYWAIHVLKIPELLMRKNISLVFDIALFLIILLNIIQPLRIVFSILFTFQITLYFICINTFYAHHYHNLIPVIAVSFIFWSTEATRISFLFQAARFYCLYAFGSPAVWKLCRGALTEKNHLSNILKGEQAAYLLQNANHPDWKWHVYTYLITHPQVSHLFFIGLFTMQIVFLTGFITTRLDYLLLLILIVFVIANYFMMGMVSYEILAIGFVLLNWGKIKSAGNL